IRGVPRQDPGEDALCLEVDLLFTALGETQFDVPRGWDDVNVEVDPAQEAPDAVDDLVAGAGVDGVVVDQESWAGTAAGTPRSARRTQRSRSALFATSSRQMRACSRASSSSPRPSAPAIWFLGVKVRMKPSRMTRASRKAASLLLA